MNDRELLELAAKAAEELTPSWYGNEPYFNGVLSRWNPLEDDGDCARIESKLSIDVKWRLDYVLVACVKNGLLSIEKGLFAEHNGDKDKARRYASTRLAAEIGKAIP